MENLNKILDKENEICISKIFNTKGIAAPITEKALDNIKSKQKNDLNKEARLHYFSIGHSFKQIDTKKVFDYVLIEELKDEKPLKFITLQKDFFTKEFSIKLQKLINSIRNINNHYVHNFNDINLNKIDSNVFHFLKESFELAIIEKYYKVNKRYPLDNEIVLFLKELFIKDENTALLNYFTNLSNDEAIEYILTFTITENKIWNINNEHNILNIEKGTYLTFEAMLFLITIFLYKNEANHLLPKLYDFKNNKSKQELFTFFSKKFTSQDIDAEEGHLIKFRDMIQYLNHYPTAWNNDLKLESENKNKIMTTKLIDSIIEFELNSNYPSFATDIQFKKEAKAFLFASNKKRNQTSFSNKSYNEEIRHNPHIKQYRDEIASALTPISFNVKEDKFKIFVKKHVLEEYFPNSIGYEKFLEYNDFTEKEKEDFGLKLYSNPKTNKLIERIDNHKLVKSHGRNQDRFMDFSMRFLAENNYFGKDAFFKCYKFYDTQEQDEFLQSNENNDDVKFHKGKVTTYIKYEEHLKNYSYWDCPFVEENNSMSVKISIGSEEKILKIQRNLMIYFLENALYNENVENQGYKLVNNYYRELKKDVEESIASLDLIKSNPDFKSKYKKILPKRLLHNYAPAKQDKAPENAFETLLKKADFREEQYKKLLKKAEHEKNKEDFVKRNKGKQFKLHFIRKACQMMYFKEKYNTLKEGNAAFEKKDPVIEKRKNKEHEFGHHKNLNITREEFNDYCKWMFAFNGNDSYKKYLRDLFSEKHFFDNQEYKNLFESSVNLEAFYAKTKELFKKWIETNKPTNNENRYTLENYKNLILQKQVFINVYHFSKYLIDKNLLNSENNVIQYKSLENQKYLNSDFYFQSKLSIDQYKTCGKLFNKLKSNKLEDCLLYEIAYNYIDKKNVHKIDIQKILTSKIILTINDANTPYKISVPFNKLERYTEMIAIKNQNNLKARFLIDLPLYLSKNKIKKGKDSTGYDIIIKNDLEIEDINTINNKIINDSVKFTEVLMELEKYFILKDKCILSKNYIDNSEIPSLKQFSKVWIKENENEIINYRNIACHFHLPLLETFDNLLLNVEQKFIKEELQNVSNINDLSKPQEYLILLFIKFKHNNFYLNLFNKNESKTIKNDKEVKKNRVLQKFINQVILKKKIN